MARTILSNTLHCYRIGDPEGPLPICEDQNACAEPGRWNTPNTPMLYTSEHYSTALLELLITRGAQLPPNARYVRITVPGGVSCETFNPDDHPGWDAPDKSVARAFGSEWQASNRSLVLIVPSIVGGGARNFLLNLRHPQAQQLYRGDDHPIFWNDQLQTLARRVADIQTRVTGPPQAAVSPSIPD